MCQLTEPGGPTEYVGFTSAVLHHVICCTSCCELTSTRLPAAVAACFQSASCSHRLEAEGQLPPAADLHISVAVGARALGAPHVLQAYCAFSASTSCMHSPYAAWTSKCRIPFRAQAALTALQVSDATRSWSDKVHPKNSLGPCVWSARGVCPNCHKDTQMLCSVRCWRHKRHPENPWPHALQAS